MIYVITMCLNYAPKEHVLRPAPPDSPRLSEEGVQILRKKYS